MSWSDGRPVTPMAGGPASRLKPRSQNNLSAPGRVHGVMGDGAAKRPKYTPTKGMRLSTEERIPNGDRMSPTDKGNRYSVHKGTAVKGRNKNGTVTTARTTPGREVTETPAWARRGESVTEHTPQTDAAEPKPHTTAEPPRRTPRPHISGDVPDYILVPKPAPVVREPVYTPRTREPSRPIWA